MEKAEEERSVREGCEGGFPPSRVRVQGPRGREAGFVPVGPGLEGQRAQARGGGSRASLTRCATWG